MVAFRNRGICTTLGLRIRPLMSCKKQRKQIPKLKFSFAHHRFDSAGATGSDLEWKVSRNRMRITSRTPARPPIPNRGVEVNSWLPPDCPLNRRCQHCQTVSTGGAPNQKGTRRPAEIIPARKVLVTRSTDNELKRISAPQSEGRRIRTYRKKIHVIPLSKSHRLLRRVPPPTRTRLHRHPIR